MTKLVLGLWQPHDPAVLLGADLRARLADAGGSRLQVNLDDAAVGPAALRLQHFAEPLTAVVSVWTAGAADEVLDVLDPLASTVTGWEVEERRPIEPPVAPDGERMDALANLAFLRRPAEMSFAAWTAHWFGPHTVVAVETQATFGYVQNLVTRPLGEDTPAVDGIVEELFPMAALTDVHAFYGSAGDQGELDRRLTRLMTSVAAFGADRDLDLVPTSRYLFELA